MNLYSQLPEYHFFYFKIEKNHLLAKIMKNADIRFELEKIKNFLHKIYDYYYRNYNLT